MTSESVALRPRRIHFIYLVCQFWSKAINNRAVEFQLQRRTSHISVHIFVARIMSKSKFRIFFNQLTVRHLQMIRRDLIFFVLLADSPMSWIFALLWLSLFCFVCCVRPNYDILYLQWHHHHHHFVRTNGWTGRIDEEDQSIFVFFLFENIINYQLAFLWIDRPMKDEFVVSTHSERQYTQQSDQWKKIE